MIHSLSEIKIAIIGLGYVGLPLAVEFGKQRDIIGFDINELRINQLNEFNDVTLEVSQDELKNASGLKFSNTLESIKDCNCYIITVYNLTISLDIIIQQLHTVKSRVLTRPVL